MTRVLVAFGSKSGGTAGLATMIAEELHGAGADAIVSPARDVHDLTGFDAVIVAGALYAHTWHRDARRFVRRNTRALSTAPVWLVSSGPLDNSAAEADIDPIPQVRRLMNRVGACGHATFGGCLTLDATGFPARTMAKTRAGDWRDRAHIRRWAATVVDRLQHRSPTPLVHRPVRPSHEPMRATTSADGKNGL